MNNARWTNTEKAELKRLWDDKQTIAAIAEALGKSESAIKNQRRFLKLTPRRTGDLAVKVRVGIHPDEHTLLRHKAIRHKQTVPARIRELIQEDNKKP